MNNNNIQEKLDILLNLQRFNDEIQLRDPNYTGTLNERLEALQTNIEKILSVPFLQGRQGDSVLIGEFHIFNEEYTYDFEPTRIGFELITKLFPLADWNAPTDYTPQSPCNDDLDIFIEYYYAYRLADPYTSNSWQDIIDNVPEYAPVNEVHAWENLCPFGEDPESDYYSDYDERDYSLTVQLYYILDYNTNEKNPIGSSRYFVYYDPRLGVISSGEESQHVFRDVSAALFRESYEENNETLWHFVNSGILPTIYWSSENGYWCWSVNGIQTGVRCEGIKGSDGKNGNAIIVKCNGNPIETNVQNLFAKYEISEVFKNGDWISDSTQFDILLNEENFLFVYFNNTIDNVLVTDMAFGISYYDNNTWIAWIEPNESIRNLISSITAKSIFDSITVDNLNGVRGMYVKDAEFDIDTNPLVHVLYSDTPNIFTISPMGYNNGPDGTISSSDNAFMVNGYKSIHIYNGNANDIEHAPTCSFLIDSNGIAINSSVQGISLAGSTTLNGNLTIYGTGPLSNTLTVSGMTNITGNTAITGKTNITYDMLALMSDGVGESLVLNHSESIGDTAYTGIVGAFTINNDIEYYQGHIPTIANKIYALKINNTGDQRYGIYCTGQCDINGVTYITGQTVIKNSSSNTAGELYISTNGIKMTGTTKIQSQSESVKVEVKNDGINLIGDTTINGITNITGTTTIKNASNVYGGQLEIDDDGIALTGTTTIKNTLFLQFNEPTQTYLVTRESDGTLKAIPQIS